MEVESGQGDDMDSLWTPAIALVIDTKFWNKETKRNYFSASSPHWQSTRVERGTRAYTLFMQIAERVARAN